MASSHQKTEHPRGILQSAVAPLHDDPAYAAAIGILHVLRAALEAERLRLDTLQLQHHLRGVSAAAQRGGHERDRISAERLATNRKKLAQIEAPTVPAAGALPASVEAALQLVRGGEIPKPADYEAQLKETRRRVEIIEAGFYFQDQVCDELRREKSREAAAALVRQHDELLVTLFRAMQDLSRAVAGERAFRAAFINAGYDLDVAADFIGAPGMVGGALQIGDEANSSSEIARYREMLARRGLLP